MKKFHFTMQGILNVRNTQRETREMELAEARQQLRAEQEKLHQIDNTMREARRPDKINREEPGYYLIQREKYLKFLRDKRNQQLQLIQEKQAQVNECMESLKLAIIEQKKMQKCRENEFDRWSKEAMKDEQKENDEISNSLYLHKKSMVRG